MVAAMIPLSLKSALVHAIRVLTRLKRIPGQSVRFVELQAGQTGLSNRVTKEALSGSKVARHTHYVQRELEQAELTQPIPSSQAELAENTRSLSGSAGLQVT